jgi:hypothetical protein
VSEVWIKGKRIKRCRACGEWKAGWDFKRRRQRPGVMLMDRCRPCHEAWLEGVRARRRAEALAKGSTK